MTPSSDIPAVSGIYRIVCTITSKFYIGSANNLRRRRGDHVQKLSRGLHPNRKLQHAWNAHGEQAFIFEVVELVLIPFLLEREQHWLDTLKPFGDIGFNIAFSAQSFHLGLTHAPETRAKMSAAKRGKPSTNLGKKASPETREKQRISHLGKIPANRGKKASPEAIEKSRAARLGKPSPRRGATLSPETREKIRIGGLGNKNHLGKKNSPEVRAKMSEAKDKEKKTLIIISPEGIEYTVHGLNKFCRERSLQAPNLMQVAQGRRRHHKGWTARFPEPNEV